MSHIDYGQDLSLNVPTPEEWLQPASRLTKYLNDVASRTDLMVTVGPGVGLGNPACFLPHRAEIRIDTAVCLPDVDPSDINPQDKLWRLEHQVFMGASAHEAGHAAHTRWTLAQLEPVTTPKIRDVIMILEEPRCEHRLLYRTSGHRLFLRSTALELILKDFTIPETPYGAAGICALVLGRVSGGSLEKADGHAVRAAVRSVLSDATVAKLEPLWDQFVHLMDLDLPGMVTVAKRWLEVLDEDPNGTDGLLFPGAGAQPNGSGSGDEDGESDAGSWIRAAVGGAAVSVDKIIVEARASERMKREMAADAADAVRHEKAEKEANSVFTPNGGTGKVTAGWRGERDATEEEQRAATELSMSLMHAEMPEIPDIGRSTKQRPPGRLRSREAAQAAAYKDLGLHGRPEMFRSRQLAPEQRSPLSVALLCDISGSMEHAAAAIASTHWVISHAGHRIGARTVAVHFGAQVHGVARVGELHAKVQMYDATDPWENFSSAFLAADHELTLLDGKGARLLVIASDGLYNKATEAKFAEAAMTLCKQKGVAVAWLQLTHRPTNNYGFGTVLDMNGEQPVAVARAIGRTAVAQMERLKS